MFGMEEHVQLPNELLFYIVKYIDDDEDGLSLAVSGAVKGFAEVYGETRNQHGITINPRCFFLTPSLWNEFFTTYISKEVITNFNANSCYWLPGDQLVGNIVKMRNLEHLGISDTKLSLPQLAKVLETCLNITKLDFSYRHLPRMENENNHFGTHPSVKEGFKKLTSLKISTAVLEARDYENDPWVFIIKMLSWCQDCRNLTVEITYTGDSIYKDDSAFPAEFPPSTFENEVDRFVREDLLPKTEWMKSLQTLVLIKLGGFENFEDEIFNGVCNVRCLLLDHLLNRMFSIGPIPTSLEHLWIHDFHYFLELVPPIIPPLKAFREYDSYLHPNSDEFRVLEQYGACDFSVSLSHLQHLKTVNGYFRRNDAIPELADPEKMLNFIREHPNLEELSVEYQNYFCETPNFYLLNAVYQLLNLKRFCCRCTTIVKEMVDEFVIVYPNIEAFYLESSTMYLTEADTDCLSAIHFKRLTSLGLEGFYLKDGSFLLPLIAQCSKLEKVYLSGFISNATSFSSNLDDFLDKALKLRDFRFEFEFQVWDRADAVHLLESFSLHAPNLERISIRLECKTPSIFCDFPLADFLIQFCSKKKHLTCLSLTFFNLDDALIDQVNQRMAEEVLSERPSLWFYLGNRFPEASDPTVPSVHYHEMIHSNYFDPPPKF